MVCSDEYGDGSLLHLFVCALLPRCDPSAEDETVVLGMLGPRSSPRRVGKVAIDMTEVATKLDLFLKPSENMRTVVMRNAHGLSS